MAGPDPQASVSAATARPSQGAFAGLTGATGTVPVGTSSLRRDILVELRRSGATSPEQLATRLGASRTGVLQQLRSLQASGLVDRRTVRHGVGRPRHLYDVTPDAQVAFPSNYDGLAAGLLAAIGMVGGDDLFDEVFGADVVRESHIASGDRSCTYRISESAEA